MRLAAPLAGPRLRPPPPIQRKLQRLALTCTVPALLALLVLLVLQYREDVGSARRHALELSVAMSVALGSQLLEVQAGLTGLSMASSLLELDLTRFDQRARAFQAASGLGPLVLLDASGRQLVNTRLPPGAALPARGSDAPAISVVRTGRPMARVVHGALQEEPIVIVGIPVQDGQGRQYSLGVRIDFDRFNRLLASQNLPSSWIAAFVDTEGKIVARSTQAGAFVGKPAGPNILAALSREAVHTGSFDGKTLDGTPALTVYSRHPGTGWSVVIGVPDTELTGELRDKLLLLAAVSLGLLALSYRLAWRHGRRITDSVALLVDASADLGRGRPVNLPPLQFHEAGQLAAAMTAASASLRAAHHDLAAAEARWRAVLDSAMDGIVMVDALQKIVSFNPAASRLFGHEPAQAIGLPLALLVPLNARDGHAGLVQRHHGVRRDGTSFPVEASISSVLVDGEQFYTVVVRDITEQLRTQEALLRSNIELQQFAFVASHDMRSPLRSIIGFLSILTRNYAGALDPRGLDLLARASSAADQLDRLTEDLLACARLDGDRRSEGPVDLDEVLATCRLMLTHEIEETGALIQSAPLPTVTGTASELTQLLQNLIGNAIKYRAPGRVPRVCIGCVQDSGAGWHLTVADNGIGIEPQYHTQVFQIFQRLHRHAAIPGFGIGLAVCRKIVERHGGRIWVESVPGTGSTFHFTLHESEAP